MMGSPMTEELREYNRVYKETNDFYHSVAKALGLSDSAFDVFYALYILGDGCLQKDICGYSYTSKQTIHSSIRRLEQDGLLETRPGRGREVRIFPTEAGRRFMAERIAPVVETENRALLRIPPEERQTFLRLLRQFAGNLREEYPGL